jgi:hypothetical protein
LGLALPQDLPVGDARGHEANDKPQSLTPISASECRRHHQRSWMISTSPERTRGYGGLAGDQDPVRLGARHRGQTEPASSETSAFSEADEKVIEQLMIRFSKGEK